MHFSIKSVLLAIAFISIAIVVYQNWLFEKRWSPIRKELVDWAESAERLSVGWVRTVANEDSVSHLIFSESPVKVDGNSFRFLKSSKAPPIGKKYFIHPPGKWVPDIETAIREWDKIDSSGSLITGRYSGS